MNVERLNLAFQRTEGLAGKYYSLTSLRTPLLYGRLSNTDSSFGPRNDKNHTFPTSIIRTPV